MSSSKRWRTVQAVVQKAHEIPLQSGMTQVGDQIRFGPKNSLAVDGKRYQLEVTYEVDGKKYEISFSMLCAPVPQMLTLAYDPVDPSKWDWPEDRTLEEDVM